MTARDLGVYDENGNRYTINCVLKCAHSLARDLGVCNIVFLWGFRSSISAVFRVLFLVSNQGVFTIEIIIKKGGRQTNRTSRPKNWATAWGCGT